MRATSIRLAATVAGATLVAGLLLAGPAPAVMATTNGVSPLSHDFGDVPVGASSAVALTITVADGWRILQVAGPGLTAPFAFGWGTCTGDAGAGTCAATESFAPTVLGPAQAHVDVTFCTGACVQAEWEVITVQLTGSGGAADLAPTVSELLPATGTKNVAPDAVLVVSFSEPVTVSIASFAFGCSLSGRHVLALSGGPATYVLDPEVDFEDGDACSLTITGDAVQDADAFDPPDTMASDASTDFWVSSDQLGPSAQAPAVSLRTGVSLSGSSIGAVVRWSGADNPGGTGLAGYELERSTDGGATWATVKAGPVTAFNVALASTGTVRFRVRGIDQVGNAGAWAYGPRLAPRLVQQSASAIRFHRTWTRAASTRFSGGSVRYARASGASATYRVTGRAIAFVTTRASTRGKVSVYVDGVRVARIDTGSVTTRFRYQAWARTWPTSGTHAIRLVVAGTSGRPRVDLDAFAVLLPAPPAP